MIKIELMIAPHLTFDQMFTRVCEQLRPRPDRYSMYCVGMIQNHVESGRLNREYRRITRKASVR